MTTTARERAKAKRYDAILRAAARLFAAHGFAGTSLEDVGAAVGVSGPAVYRHVASKGALLGAVLTQASDNLVAGGEGVIAETPEGIERMRRLIDFHVRFALENPDVIRVQDRDAQQLSADDYAEVRRTQRAYINLWMRTLATLLPEASADLRLRVQAVFGLINSTPHSTSAVARAQAHTAQALASMAEAALLSESHE